MDRKWEEWEEDYMERKYLYQPVEKTMKHLNRTKASVLHKASRMHLNHNVDRLNATNLANCLGIDISVVIRWVTRCGLPCKTIKYNSSNRYIIDVKDFWKWAEKNKHLIIWKKYQRLSLPPEPSWLEDEIKKPQRYNNNKKYTEEEKLRIKSMLRKGYSAEEIAEQMNRTLSGIRCLCKRIYL